VVCVDATLRQFDGTPTYGLTDNERTVTTEQVADAAVHNLRLVEVGR
jgi:hypothetical protein